MRDRLFAALWKRSERALEPQLAALRREVTGDLRGAVLEIGCGTGANFAHYPHDATVTAIERNEHLVSPAHAAAVGAAAPVTVCRADAMALPFADGTFDAAVGTLVLCSVADLGATLAEMRRVLRPGGALRLLEHVRSEQRWAALTQRAATPLWQLVAGGCHLDRDSGAAVHAAGFEVEAVRRLRLHRLPHIVLRAHRPAA